MKHSLASMTVAALCALAVGAPKQGKLPPRPADIAFGPLNWQVPLGKPYRTTLPNGLNLYLAVDSTLPLVQISGYAFGGSIYDPAGKEGLAALATRLMRTGGTHDYQADSLDALIERLAIGLSVGVDETQVVFNASFLSEFTDTALALLGQVLVHPAFEAPAVAKERELAIQDVRHRFDNPHPILDAAYDKIMYPGAPNSRLATEKSLSAITRDDMVAFHHRIFRTENMLLAVSGRFNRDNFARKLAAIFPSTTVKAHDSLKADIHPGAKVKCLVVAKPISQAYVRLGLPLFARPHPDYYPMSVLNEILGGGGFNSRLESKIRSDKGLTYSIHSEAGSNYVFPATFSIAFFTKSSTTSPAIALTLAEVERIRKDGVTDEELSSAKSVLTQELPSMFRSPNDIVKNYAWSEYYGRPDDHFKVYPDKINAITKADLARVARTYLDPAAFSYVVVGDTAAIFAADTLKEFSLRKLTPRKATVADSLAGLW